MSEMQRAQDYLASFGIESTPVETSTEWGVEMRATLMGKEVTKIDTFPYREEAEAAADIRGQLPFVKWVRVVCREVTTTPWEEA